MSRAIRLVVMILAAAAAGGLITYVVVHPQAAEEGEGGAAPAPRISIVNGEPTIMLDAATQQKIGLATTAARATRENEEIQLFGTVVDVQDLAALENEAATARAQGEQAKAKGATDRAELTRLRALNADNKNVSDRAVQEAAAAVAADDSAAASADASLRAALGSATQRFGPRIAEAVSSQSDLFKDLVSLRQLLIQITMPPGGAAPKVLNVTASGEGGAPAQLLAPAPRVDPRLQGVSYFYTAPGGTLAAGMVVTARYAASRANAGVLVPSDAAVSFEGKSWVYIRSDATHFVRHEISIAVPIAGGFFVTDIRAGSELVTTGAQQLLSEEMRAQLHEE